MECNGFDFLLEKRLGELSPALCERYRHCMAVFDMLLEKFHLVFPTFTDHSLLHCMNVLNYSNMLMGENVFKLSADEIYIYLVAVALHDSGMSIEEKKFDDYVSKAGVTEYVKAHPEESAASVSRRFHNEFSAIFIKEKASLFDIPDDRYAEAIAKVARGHRKADLFDREDYPADYPVTGESPVNLAALGAYLRIADEMDMATDRNSKLLYELNSADIPDPVSYLEFLKCESIKKVCCADRKLQVFCEPPDKIVLDGVKEYVKGLLEKLVYCKDVITGAGDFDFPYSDVELIVTDPGAGA